MQESTGSSPALILAHFGIIKILGISFSLGILLPTLSLIPWLLPCLPYQPFFSSLVPDPTPQDLYCPSPISYITNSYSLVYSF